MFASFNNVNTKLVYVVSPLLLLACVLLFRQHRLLDVFKLDKDNAVSLGVDVHKVTRNVLLNSALLISISTAKVGPILFLAAGDKPDSRMVPLLSSLHLAACHVGDVGVRPIIRGVDHRKVFHFGTTLSVVINFIGGIFFLSLLLRNKVV